jgi:glycosyltransferase involved in cell wall biosynthesis
MKKVLIIGPYNSVGGVSVHIIRLCNLLKNYFLFTIIDESPLDTNETGVYKLREKNIFKYFSLMYKTDIVHIHSGVNWLRLAHIIISRILFKKAIITIHSFKNKNKIDFYFTFLAIKLANRTIFVSEEMRSQFEAKKSIVLPAFIPPDLTTENSLPAYLRSVLEDQKSKGKTIISANAFQVITFQGQDLYGIDLCIDCAQQFCNRKANVFIFFIIASLNNGLNTFQEYQAKIRKEKLEDYILLYPEPISFVRLVLESDIILRPTNTDGDALTIREGLYFGKPVIASNVVARPKGTILFENRNSIDLFGKINNVINNKEEKSESILKEDFQKVYFNIYSNEI